MYDPEKPPGYWVSTCDRCGSAIDYDHHYDLALCVPCIAECSNDLNAAGVDMSSNIGESYFSPDYNSDRPQLHWFIAGANKLVAKALNLTNHPCLKEDK